MLVSVVDASIGDRADDLVAVHVPKSRLAEVYKLLGSPPAPNAHRERLPLANAAASDASEDWTIEQLAVISGDRRRSFLVVQQMMDTLAASADDFLPVSVICERLKCSRAELRGALSGLGRVRRIQEITAAHGMPWWPQTTSSDDGGTETEYMLSSTAAERWTRLQAR